jgi:chromosome segregation ATPase
MTKQKINKKTVGADMKKAISVDNPSSPEMPSEDLGLHKKVDQLAEDMAKITALVNQTSNSIADLTANVSDVKRDTEELYRDREAITTIKEEVINLDGKLNQSMAKQTSIETGLKEEIRKIYSFVEEKIKTVAGTVSGVEERVKVLEQKPVSADDIKIKILFRLGRLIIGKTIK